MEAIIVISESDFAQGRQRSLRRIEEFAKAMKNLSKLAKAPLPKVTAPIKRSTPKIGRNAPCPCGSGRKFKRCCRPAK